MTKPKSFTPKYNEDHERESNDSDVVSFWLLLLFIATFFGIAAEEARRPSSFQSPLSITANMGRGNGAHNIIPQAYSIDGQPLQQELIDAQSAARRRFDLSSDLSRSDHNATHLEIPGKLANPATGK
jgi:hypothetical protein